MIVISCQSFVIKFYVIRDNITSSHYKLKCFIFLRLGFFGWGQKKIKTRITLNNFIETQNKVINTAKK
jgi:hypothetical protein